MYREATNKQNIDKLIKEFCETILWFGSIRKNYHNTLTEVATPTEHAVREVTMPL